MGRELVAWRSECEVGVEEIDKQHRILIDLINQVWQCIVVQPERQRVITLIESLEQYMVTHFTTEEAYMTAIDYPGFLEHKIMHRHFAKRITDEKENVINGGSLTLSLVQYLKEWLLDHIQHVDKAVGDFSREKLLEKEKEIARIEAQAQNSVHEHALQEQVARQASVPVQSTSLAQLADAQEKPESVLKIILKQFF